MQTWAWICLCVDVRPPRIVCPSSQLITLGGSETRTLTLNTFAATVTDASETTVTYNPETLSLTTTDTYTRKTVTVTATDSASLSASCTFDVIVKRRSSYTMLLEFSLNVNNIIRTILKQILNVVCSLYLWHSLGQDIYVNILLHKLCCMYEYCEVIKLCGHEISWLDDIGHVCGHLNLWISNYSWTSLCRSGRDPEKYFDIGMVRDNHLGIMGSETFWQIFSF